MHLGKRIVAGVGRRFTALRDYFAIARSTRHLYGPTKVVLDDTDCAVVSLMKDAEYFVETFIRHHQAMGAAHILIVDNGSGDATLEIARRFENVTVVQNTMPARLHECQLRTQSARSVFQGGWLLFVDSDELFDVPLGSGPTLPRLITYLNTQGYTAMVTQMLDLFSPQSYRATKNLTSPATVTAFTQYSLGQITRLPYHDKAQVAFSWFMQSNDCADPGVMLQTGGLRREVFDETPFLSKHSLVRNQSGVNLMSHPHCASDVRIADVTGLLRHYKLAGPYMDRDRKSVAARTWDHDEDRRRVARTSEGDSFAITVADPKEFTGTKALLDQGFLYASERYRAFMASKA